MWRRQDAMRGPIEKSGDCRSLVMLLILAGTNGTPYHLESLKRHQNAVDLTETRSQNTESTRRALFFQKCAYRTVGRGNTAVPFPFAGNEARIQIEFHAYGSLSALTSIRAAKRWLRSVKHSWTILQKTLWPWAVPSIRCVMSLPLFRIG